MKPWPNATVNVDVLGRYGIARNRTSMKPRLNTADDSAGRRWT